MRIKPASLGPKARAAVDAARPEMRTENRRKGPIPDATAPPWSPKAKAAGCLCGLVTSMEHGVSYQSEYCPIHKEKTDGDILRDDQ